ncbi:hypothetical protein [Fimbriimonas ginsengisoli]|uniref:Uncharacterized protein n=1 Tax=Fimbriimonas ginsengisoli Gsoil 348 TaxID=661478 RepID=A0A068NSW6_FIMGI|nr:hypothetical protein [Fimbriimonas ginsengisoli]AIE86608.1 hypothetical protein OP10G_3240 [Fimbriimonas ginsengisoli Gsoil 348]
MLIESVLMSMLALSGPAPKLIAIQEWKGSKRVRAWTPEGKPLPTIIPVDRSDGVSPRITPAIELVAVIPNAENEEFPNVYWKIVRGLKGYYDSSAWKDHDPASKLAAFSLVGFAKGREATVDLFVAAGPPHPITPTATLKRGVWQSVGPGFRVRYTVSRRMNDLRRWWNQPSLELEIPEKYANWDIVPEMKLGGHNLTVVGYPSHTRRRVIELENGAGDTAALTLLGRPYIGHRFEHVRLRPNG